MPVDLATAALSLGSALIGTMGGAVSTIYITGRQTKEHFRKQIWEARRGAYNEIIAELQKVIIVAYVHREELVKFGSSHFETDEGTAQFARLMSGIEGLRPIIDGHLVLMPFSLITAIEQFRAKLQAQVDLAQEGGMPVTVYAKLLLDTLSELRTELLKIARNELLGEKAHNI